MYAKTERHKVFVFMFCNDNKKLSINGIKTR